MSLSMYQASVPVFVRGMTNLIAIIDKAAAHADAKKIEQSVFMASRLAPDMLALPRQVQIVSDTARRCVARLAGVEPTSMEDTAHGLDRAIAHIEVEYGACLLATPSEGPRRESSACMISTSVTNASFRQ